MPRRTVEAIQKSLPSVSVFRRCCCRSPRLPSHLFPLSHRAPPPDQSWSALSSFAFWCLPPSPKAVQFWQQGVLAQTFVSHGRQPEVQCLLFRRGFAPYHGQEKLLLMTLAWLNKRDGVKTRPKREKFKFRLPSLAHKRLCLSSLMLLPSLTRVNLLKKTLVNLEQPFNLPWIVTR